MARQSQATCSLRGWCPCADSWFQVWRCRGAQLRRKTGRGFGRTSPMTVLVSRKAVSNLRAVALKIRAHQLRCDNPQLVRMPARSEGHYPAGGQSGPPVTTATHVSSKPRARAEPRRVRLQSVRRVGGQPIPFPPKYLLTPPVRYEILRNVPIRRSCAELGGDSGGRERPLRTGTRATGQGAGEGQKGR